ncbi:MAG: ubiquitin-like protein UBact [Verrucomicrobiota bacterium]
MPDQKQKQRPAEPAPEQGGGGDGPSAPKVEKPNVDKLLKRMRKVDPDQAKRYRQRTGE